MSDEVVVREVRLHSPGWIEGVAHAGDFPGNSIVRLNASNEVVEVVPMNAPQPVDVLGDAQHSEESIQPAPLEEVVVVSDEVRMGG